MSSDLEVDVDAVVEPAPAVPVTDTPPHQLYREGRRLTADVTGVPDVVATVGDDAAVTAQEAAGPVGIPGPHLPIPIPPLLLRRSGIYRADRIVALPPIPTPIPIPVPIPRPPVPPIDPHGPVPAGAVEDDTAQVRDEAALTPLPLTTEELRVDIDGLFPTMTISGTISRLFGGRLTWIARVTKDAAGHWTGPISYKDGTTTLRPHTTVSVKLTGSILTSPGRKAKATFSGGPGGDVTKEYTFETSAFRTVAFEYDTVSDATAVTAYDPATHPNRPSTAPTSTLSLEAAYSRVGIQVTRTGGDGVIPIGGAGANATWSDLEMHDAMEAHWSRWVDAPQWAVWVLFARLHDQGTGLGGIMFDDIGAAQRQGTAIFSDSFIAQAPAGEADPGPWVQRMRFWTAAHEIGHTFNLAHSWQKSLGAAWVPLANEPGAMSYMNYPFKYPAGTDAFFAAFDFRFSPDELLFLRHAPERFVKQGASAWFDDHGFEGDAFEQLRAAATGPLDLDLRVHRTGGRYEYLEPVVAELRMRNTSSTAQVLDANLLADVAVVVQKDGGPAKRWAPFAHRCEEPAPQVLQPGEAVYRSVFLSAAPGGWLIGDPGSYQVYAAADLGNGGVAMSSPLRLTVGRPQNADAERLADGVFTREVAHTLAFGGSRELTEANDVLRDVVDRLPGSRAAVHAASALGAPKASTGKVLAFDPAGLQEQIALVPAEPAEAKALLEASLSDFDAAADSLGHIGVTARTRLLAGVLAEEGETAARTELLETSADTLAARGVLPGVVAELRRSAGA